MPEKVNITKRDIKSIAGSLSSYTQKRTVCFKEAREKVLEEMVEGEYGKAHHLKKSGKYLPSLKRFRSSIRIKGKPVSTVVLLDREEKR